MYNRILQDQIPRDISSFIFGPRQSGKTTILKKIDYKLYVNLLQTSQFVKYNREPSILYDEISALQSKGAIIIIDEIQKIPLLLDEVQRCMDDYPELIFILSGSSARKLKRGSANLLGGRAANLSLYPLTIKELGKEFDLERVLAYGSLPKISLLLAEGRIESAKTLLNSYVTTYLTEEIKAESLVRKLEYFQRFLEVAAHQFAREINMSELADQAQITASSVKNYFGILEDTLLGFFLYPFSSSIRKQLTKTPKFYFFDNGVTRAIQGVIASKPTNQESGYLFEQLMIQEVVRVNSYYSKGFKLSFWKTPHNAEVDLLLSRGNKLLLAVEFKATPFPSKRDLSGLKAFEADYPKVPTLLCAPVDRARMIDDRFKAIPPQDFLELVAKL
jgi:predicted AAA+ superfamily ATPase